MKRRTQKVEPAIHPCIAKRATLARRNVSDGPSRNERRGLDERPKDLRRRVQGSRRNVNRLVKEFRSRLDAKLMGSKGRADARHAYPLSFDDHYKNIVDGEAAKQPFHKLAPYLKRFDWRVYGIVPRPRHQPAESDTCWAFAATAAFESSLMFQSGRFDVTSGDDNIDTYDVIALNVNLTINEVKKTGRHEYAFAHFVKHGIPLHDIIVNDIEHRDARLAPTVHRPSVRRRAIAWDWVLARSWETPIDVDSIRKIKEALLYHGPLVVSVDAGGEFKHYGASDKTIRLENKPGAAARGMNLRFPARMVSSSRDKKSGSLFITFPDDVITGWDVDADNLQVRFPMNHAPRLERRKNTEVRLRRPTFCDDAVIAIPLDNPVSPKGIAFTMNNAVKIEKDSATGEVVLQFPENTDAEFDVELATGDLIINFPADKAPVFGSDRQDPPDHFVLLIGWDDNKCAWIVQNTYENWGYQCKSPQGVFNKISGGLEVAYEDRAYMYIEYGCNAIGRNAAWIEAPLLSRKLLSD